MKCLLQGVESTDQWKCWTFHVLLVSVASYHDFSKCLRYQSKRLGSQKRPELARNFLSYLYEMFKAVSLQDSLYP